MKDNIIGDLNLALKILCDHMDKSNILIGRIGGVEFDAYVDYKNNGFNKDSIYIKNLLTYCGYYDKNVTREIFEKYMTEFEKYYKNCDLLTIANAALVSYCELIPKNDIYYSNQYSKDKNYINVLENDILYLKKIPKFSYYVIESMCYFQSFFSKLNNKKILIISPFENEIKQQLKVKDELFTMINNFKYPTFTKVEYINTFLTTNSYDMPHNNIMETFEYYTKQLNDKDFDIALLICGAYAYPFANYIKNVLQKSCIHIGGIGQLFFGIKGGRYLTPYFKQFMNDKWIYPFREINKNAPNVPKEDGLLGYFRRE